MPRRGERRAQVSEAGDGLRRSQAQVFERTKMCRFHIIGACTRGTACHFAHDCQELSEPPDLFRTKLCKTLIHTGQCADVECRYAHTKEELRLVRGFNWSDKNPMDNDQEVKEAYMHARLSNKEEGLRQQFTGQGWQNGMTLHAEAQPFQPQLASAGSTEQLWDCMGSATPAAFQLAAMRQMAEAAKAHAAEAARLQTMASYLEAHGAVAARAAMGNVLPGRGGIPLPAFSAAGTAAGTNSLSGSGSCEGPSFDTAAAATSTGATLPSVMAAPRASAGSAGEAPLPAAEDTAVATGNSSATATAAGAGTLGASALTQNSPFNKSEPAQINPKTLRSYSSECLVQLEAMAKLEGIQQADTGVPTPSRPLGSLSSSIQTGSPEGNSASSSLAWTVKNTFVDFEPQQQPPQGGLRSICSAAGRLDALGDAVSQPDSPELLPHTADQQGFLLTPGRASYVNRGSALGLLTKDLLPPAQDVVQDAFPPARAAKEAAAASVGVGERAAMGTTGTTISDTPTREVQPAYSGDNTEQGQSSVVIQSPVERLDCHPLLDDGLGEGSFTVKNTFLDFGPAAPSTLRSVRTAAGRLDCMAEESPLHFG